MKIFSASLAMQWMPGIKLIATDMDGTITCEGKFAPQLLERLEQLQVKGVPVIITTGRSAGWVSALVEYLPIRGAIAENGGYLYTPEHPQGIPLIDIGDPVRFRQKLHQVFEALQRDYPQLSPSADNPFRVTDWTFDKGDLSDQALQQMKEHCETLGWDFTYSSIQCHIKLPMQSKQLGLLKALKEHLPGQLAAHQLLTMGDSPNDTALLDSSVFQYSIGVANIQPYLSTMEAQPRWMSAHSELSGFLDVTQGFLNLD